MLTNILCKKIMSFYKNVNQSIKNQKIFKKNLFEFQKGHKFQKLKNQICFLDFSNLLNITSTKSKESEMMRTCLISVADILEYSSKIFTMSKNYSLFKSSLTQVEKMQNSS